MASLAGKNGSSEARSKKMTDYLSWKSVFSELGLMGRRNWLERSEIQKICQIISVENCELFELEIFFSGLGLISRQNWWIFWVENRELFELKIVFLGLALLAGINGSREARSRKVTDYLSWKSFFPGLALLVGKNGSSEARSQKVTYYLSWKSFFLGLALLAGKNGSSEARSQKNDRSFELKIVFFSGLGLIARQKWL